MLIDVVPVVRQLVPGLLRHSKPSVACVLTTHQKYLVFDADASHPACVVEIGDEKRLRRIDRILTSLHARCPREVPQSLACASWGPGTVVHIQEGLPGVPWFRLFDTLTTPEQWQALLDRSVAMMRKFHAAISDVPEWVGSIHPGDALAEQAVLWESSGSPNPRLAEAIAACIDVVDGAPEMPAVAQHGDFSLNNLMVASDGMAVIDFEEFGLTRVPLHDAIGLGLSFSMSQDDRCPISVRDCVERCIGGPGVAEAFDPGVLRALLLHHLLWRINQSHGLPARARLRAKLTSLVEKIALAPGNGLSGLTLAA
jgi:hypothetical protein